MNSYDVIMTNISVFFERYYYFFLYWSILWKGLVFWRSAKQNQKYWFIIFMFINTVGILEIVYLFYFSKKRLTIKEIKTWSIPLFNRKIK